MRDPRATMSIADASEHTGLTPRQIRYLEERGHILPQYIKIGSARQRRYSAELVELLAEIAKFRQEGLTLKAAVEKSA